MLKVIFLVEGELSFAFFCPFGYIPHPLDAPHANVVGLPYREDDLAEAERLAGLLARRSYLVWQPG